MIKKKILSDLDIVTVAFWDKKDEAIKFLNRIKSAEFVLYTPFIILNLLTKWKHESLRNKIINFYEVYSDKIITIKSYDEKIKEIKLDDKKLSNELLSHQIKEEDIVLVIFASIFNLDYLVTFNRKHLKDKEQTINEVLKKYGVNTIRIVLPSEI
ncbi:MAG: hypothetical protein AABX33_07670 [Nanoarchaeota archaeon]